MAGPRLSFFPCDGNVWRIDWYGDVAFPDRRQSYKQPAICVMISNVTMGSTHGAQPNRNQSQVWVPVGLLPLIRVGDFWKNGLRLDHQQAVSTSFNLKISRGTCRIVKAGISIKDRVHLLPVDSHPWHMRHTHSFCLMVKAAHDQQLVIPCAEMIRFYFGSSSSLIAKLFAPPLERSKLYSKAQYSPAGSRLQLKLATGISGYSASDIGRIHLNPHAWAAASEVGLSLLEASTRGAKVYPRSRFPFIGETTLVVNGEWLPLGDRINQTFLVHHIQSCSHVFPFRTLAYDMAGPSKVAQATQQNQRLHSPLLTPQSFSLDHRVSVVHRNPSKFFSPTIWTTSHEVKFPDLETKCVFRKNPTGLSKPNTPTSVQKSSTVTALAISEPTGSHQPIRPLTLEMPADSRRLLSAPDFLRATLQEILAIPTLSLTLMTASHHDGWTVLINALQDDNRAIAKGLYTKGSKTERVRRACVLHIEKNHRSIGLLALVEDTPTRAFLEIGVPASDDGLSLVLQSAATKFLTKRARPVSSMIRQLRKNSE